VAELKNILKSEICLHAIRTVLLCRKGM